MNSPGRPNLLRRRDHHILDAIDDLERDAGVGSDLHREHLGKQRAKRAWIALCDLPQVLSATGLIEGFDDGLLDVGGQLIGRALFAAGAVSVAAVLGT